MAKDHDVLDDLRDQTISLLLKHGVEKQTASIVAHELREIERQNWGGQIIYFSKTKDPSERDMEIYNKFNGSNKDELIREYDISFPTFYKIINRAHSEYVKKNQFKLDI